MPLPYSPHTSLIHNSYRIHTLCSSQMQDNGDDRDNGDDWGAGRIERRQPRYACNKWCQMVPGREVNWIQFVSDAVIIPPKQFFLNHFEWWALTKQKFLYLLFIDSGEPAKLFYRNKSIFGLFVLFTDPLEQLTCCPRFFACNILHILCIQYDTLRYPFRQILHKIVKTGCFRQPGAIPAPDIFPDKYSTLILYCNCKKYRSGRRRQASRPVKNPD